MTVYWMAPGPEACRERWCRYSTGTTNPSMDWSCPRSSKPQIAAGSTPDRMVIERVVLNTPLDPHAFALPVAAHPPLRGRPLPEVGAPGAQGPAPVTPSDSRSAAGRSSGATPQPRCCGEVVSRGVAGRARDVRVGRVQRDAAGVVGGTNYAPVTGSNNIPASTITPYPTAAFEDPRGGIRTQVSVFTLQAPARQRYHRPVPTPPRKPRITRPRQGEACLTESAMGRSALSRSWHVPGSPRRPVFSLAPRRRMRGSSESPRAC